MSKKDFKTKEFQKKIKALLYKKGIYEHKVKVAQNGANVYMGYVKALESKLSELEEGSFEYYKTNAELLENKRIARDWISDYNQYRNYYNEGLYAELEDALKKKEFKKLEWVDFEHEAQEMVKHELFGKVVFVPENIELPEVIHRIELQIENLNNYAEEIRNELDSSVLTSLRRAELIKTLFSTELHAETLTKRLNERKEYYVEQFLPMYEKDMKDCEEYLETYLSYADFVIEYNIDPHINFMIQKYREEKEEGEGLWLFFTALRKRLKEIAVELSKNPDILDKHVKLKPFVEHFVS